MSVAARVICFLSALLLPMYSGAEDRFWESFSIKKGEEKILSDGGLPVFYDFEINAAIKGNRNVAGVGKASWGVAWRDSNGDEIMRVALLWGNDYLGDPFDRRFLRVEVNGLWSGQDWQKVLSQDFYENVGLFGQNNCLTAECSDQTLRLWVGAGAQCYVGEVPAPTGAASAVLWSSGTLNVELMAWRPSEDPADALAIGADLDDIEKCLLDSRDPLEGIWRFLDRDTDTRWAEIGGNYRLAVVRHGCVTEADAGTRGAGDRPVYDILFLEGAVVNGPRWNPGMVKGYLYGTVFENHYELVWFDSMMESMGDEVSADVVAGGAILSLNFPLYHSIVRFSKEPRPAAMRQK